MCASVASLCWQVRAVLYNTWQQRHGSGMLPYFARLFLLVLVALEVAEATEGLKDFFEHIVHAAP